MRMRLCSLVLLFMTGQAITDPTSVLYPFRQLPVSVSILLRSSSGKPKLQPSSSQNKNRIRAPLPKTKTDSNSKLDYRLWSAADLLKIVRTTSRRSWKTGNVWTLCERSARSQKTPPPRSPCVCVRDVRAPVWVSAMSRMSCHPACTHAHSAALT